MTRDDRWQEVKELLDEALGLPPDDRRAFLEDACPDALLRGRVASLLEIDEELGDFITTPAFSLRGDDPVDQASREGSRIGPYELTRELGRGGMGAVYLAARVDEEFDQRVAVKILKRGMDSDEIVRRFRVERQILADLAHPNVAGLMDGGTTDDGLPYFVMEYVEGERIDRYCEAHRLSTRQRIQLFRQVCAAVHFAHRNLVVHRDLKPANILVTADGVPKLLDFGIAKILRKDAGCSTVTSPGAAPMTLDYASPEQIRGAPVTTAADVYALGALLHELLTGTRARRFDASDPPPKPSAVVAGGLRRRLIGDLDTIVLTALREDPERRFASAEQLSEDLRRHLEGLPVRSRPDTLSYRAGKFVRRHAWGVAVAALAAGVVLAFAVMTVVQSRAVARERDRVQAVMGFFVEDFLTLPDPKRSRGETVTIREALEAAVPRLEEELADEPAIRAALLDAIGRVYRNLGLDAEARPLLEEALRLRRENLGRGHPLVAASLLNLANVERTLGAGEAAEGRMRRALDLLRRNYPRGHPDLARGINNLASWLWEADELEEAEALAREALEMKRKLLGADHPDVATTLNTLATVLRAKGQAAEAETRYRECLAIRRRRGPLDPELANALANLAGLLADTERPAEALPLAREALEIRRRLHDGDHPGLVLGLNNLGVLLTEQGSPEEARALLEEALQMERRLSGGDSRRGAVVEKNLASAWAADGDFPRCEALARTALARLRETGGGPHVAEAESLLDRCRASSRRWRSGRP